MTARQPSLWDWEPPQAADASTAGPAPVAPPPITPSPGPRFTAPTPPIAPPHDRPGAIGERPPTPTAAYAPRILRVSEVNRRVRFVLDDDPMLGDVWVEGEVSAPSLPPSGHCYFTLKDSASQIRAVMFREELERAQVRPAHGMQVICHGRVRGYEAQGVYQLYVESLQPAGRGDLHQRYEALRAKLTAEGLFAAERKRQLPRWPRRIGVVTSPIGAVWRDIGNVMRRRYPHAELILSPSVVQGEAAAPAIVGALQRLYRQPALDVVIVARGGGSLEDLWSFNDERVVRCLAESPVPTVVGVGHETDVTLADFAADLRAPTPSAAAELAVPDATQLPAIVGRLRDRATAAALAAVADRRRRLDGEARALSRLEPNLPALRQRAAELLDRADRSVRGILAARHVGVVALGDRLRAVGPAATLGRGYAVARRAGGGIVRDPAQVSAGEGMEVVVQHGTIGARVESTVRRDAEDVLR